ASGERHGDGQLSPDDIKSEADSRTAARGQSVEEGLSNETSPRTEGQGPEDVLPGLHAAIEEHFATVIQSFRNTRKRRDRRDCTVELPAAVVGNNHGICAYLVGPTSIFRIQDPLEDQFTRPFLAHPLHVLPCYSRIKLRSDPLCQCSQARARRQAPGQIPKGASLAEEHVTSPPWLSDDIQRIAKGHAGRNRKSILELLATESLDL